MKRMQATRAHEFRKPIKSWRTHRHERLNFPDAGFFGLPRLLVMEIFWVRFRQGGFHSVFPIFPIFP